MSGEVGGPVGGRHLVLGATGFVGRWVVRVLERGGDEVVPHARDRRLALEVLGDTEAVGRLIVADLSEPARVEEVLRRSRPSAVYNLVGYGVDRGERDERTAFRINGGLVGDLCRATARHGDAAGRGARLVHAGSAAEYGDAGGDLSEETEPRPTTLYGRSKLAGTRELGAFCRRTGLRGLTARLFTLFGPGEHRGRLLPSLLAAADTGSPIRLTGGRQRRDFTYVEDAAEGLVRLAASDASPGQVVNLATGRLAEVRSFALEAAGVLGLEESQLRFGAIPTRDEEMDHEPVSVERLRRLTGWLPSTTIAEGVRRTLDHARAAGTVGGRGRAPEASR